MILLKTKLQPPRPIRDFIPRNELLTTINDNLGRDLTLVAAPAGYGKTTLISEWVRQSPIPAAWLSLDENDNEPTVFLDYVVAAIRTLYPDACATTASLARSSGATATGILATLFVSEIDDLPDRFALVLEDYHVITRPEIHQFIEQLLLRPPLQLHLIITSRSDPPFSLARLRAGGLLTELRVRELRFRPNEAQEILIKTTGISDRKIAARLAERSEGWIAGLHLASLTLRGGDSPPGMVGIIEDNDDLYVLDYLFDQVLRRLTLDVAAYLMQTSIVGRISDELAYALILPEPGVTLPSLYSLERAGLFLTVLDATGVWYSYHGLFHNVLQRALAETYSPADIAELHRRAAHWFAARGLIDEAIMHALESGDHGLAATITRDSIGPGLFLDSTRHVARWLDRLPPSVVESDPGLLIARVHVLFDRLQWLAAPDVMRQAEAQLAAASDRLDPEDIRQMQLSIEMLWVSFLTGTAQPEQVEPFIDRALRGELGSDPPFKAIVMLPVAMQWLGRFDDAEQWLNQLLSTMPNKPFDPMKAVRVLFAQATLYMSEGHLDRARQIADMLLATATNLRSPGFQAWARLILGAAALSVNDLPKAIEHFEAGVPLRYDSSVVTAQECLSGLALAYQHLGKQNEAHGVLSIMADYHRELVNPQLNIAYRALRARLALMEGDLAQAAQWSGGDMSDVGLVLGWFVIPAITTIRIALATDYMTPIPQLCDELERLIAEVKRLRQPIRQVELLSLRAVAAARLGDAAAAKVALQEALAIGEPRGLIRPIIDAGPDIAPLLQAAGTPSPYLKRLQTALRQPVTGGAVERPRLTPREKEVLALLGDYQTDRVIADTLVVSPLTVRTHIENLGEKLGVRGRRTIVDRARELGLLN